MKSDTTGKWSAHHPCPVSRTKLFKFAANCSRSTLTITTLSVRRRWHFALFHYSLLVHQPCKINLPEAIWSERSLILNEGFESNGA